MSRKPIRWTVFATALTVVIAFVIASCSGGSGGLDISSIAQDRGLTNADVVAAVKTYQPTGRMDEYLMFASGGHSGQVAVIGIPSMRLLKSIAVFTPEPWQGYATGSEEHNVLMESGRMGGRDITWGDTHHPALSETDADYDGGFLFINDKANPRIAVIDLRDFETKQIIVNPNMGTNHGGTFVTPNTEYIIEGAQYAVPLWTDFADLDRYEEDYRGLVGWQRTALAAHQRIQPDWRCSGSQVGIRLRRPLYPAPLCWCYHPSPHNGQ